MKFASRVNPRVNRGKSGQGFYVVGPDGSGYGHTNRRGAGVLERFASGRLVAYKRNPPSVVPDFGPRRAQPHPDITVVGTYSRIRPLPAGAVSSNRSVGRDFLYLYPDEVRSLSATPLGQRDELPPTLAQRLARYNLVDNVRGEPDFWATGDLRTLDIGYRIVSDEAGVKKARIHGNFVLVTATGARGYQGTFDGEALIRGDRLVQFKAIASGTAWGRGQWTPGQPSGRFPLLIGFEADSTEVAKFVPPTALTKGEPYAPAEIVALLAQENIR